MILDSERIEEYISFMMMYVCFFFHLCPRFWVEGML